MAIGGIFEIVARNADCAYTVNLGVLYQAFICNKAAFFVNANQSFLVFAAQIKLFQ